MKDKKIGSLKKASAPVLASIIGETGAVKINIWDQMAVKNNLDDAIKKATLEALERFEEKFEATDFKLCICTIACVFALVAVVYGYLVPHPQNNFVVGICVVIYFTCMSVLTVWGMLFEKQLILEASAPSLERPGSFDRLEVAGLMQRYDHKYSIRISFRMATKTLEHTLDTSVAEFFYTDGVLATDKVNSTMKDLIQTCLSKKID